MENKIELSCCNSIIAEKYLIPMCENSDKCPICKRDIAFLGRPNDTHSIDVPNNQNTFQLSQPSDIRPDLGNNFPLAGAFGNQNQNSLIRPQGNIIGPSSFNNGIGSHGIPKFDPLVPTINDPGVIHNFSGNNNQQQQKNSFPDNDVLQPTRFGYGSNPFGTLPNAQQNNNMFQSKK